jgi:hypothetical protein
VAAAISIAGAADVFGSDFFGHAAVPFLMIAGTADGIVDYAANAQPIPDRVRDGGLLSFEGGTHVGFADVASGAMRIFGNPDAFVCRLAASEREPSPANPFNEIFGSPSEGLLEVLDYAPPCEKTFEHPMAAGRQKMFTTVAVRAFFESRFARPPEARAEHAEFLTRTLPTEVPDVRYTPGRR